MTASLQVSKKDNKYYIHLQWRQNGKRVQKCIGTGLSAKDNNKRKAEKMMRDTLAEWEAKITVNYENIAFSEYLRRWLEEIRHTLEESTYENYKGVIQTSIAPFFDAERINLAELTGADLQRFYNHRIEAGISPNTIRRYHAIIHHALGAAVKRRKITANPADEVELPKQVKHIARFFDAEQSRKLLQASKGTKLEPVVLIATCFGLRRGEILGLRWSCVDLQRGVLRVEGVIAKIGGKLVYKRPKTEASVRCLPIPHAVVEALKSLWQQQEENRKRRRYNHAWDDFVCVDAQGNILHPDYVTHALPKLCAQCGLPEIRLHELRHTNISILLDRGASMKEVQEWAGHSRFSTTADTYAHVLAGSKNHLAQSIDSALLEPIG